MVSCLRHIVYTFEFHMEGTPLLEVFVNISDSQKSWKAVSIVSVIFPWFLINPLFEYRRITNGIVTNKSHAIFSNSNHLKSKKDVH